MLFHLLPGLLLVIQSCRVQGTCLNLLRQLSFTEPLFSFHYYYYFFLSTTNITTTDTILAAVLSSDMYCYYRSAVARAVKARNPRFLSMPPVPEAFMVHSLRFYAFPRLSYPQMPALCIVYASELFPTGIQKKKEYRVPYIYWTQYTRGLLWDLESYSVIDFRAFGVNRSIFFFFFVDNATSFEIRSYDRCGCYLLLSIYRFNLILWDSQ